MDTFSEISSILDVCTYFCAYKEHADIIQCNNIAELLLTGKLSDIPTFDSPSSLLAFTRPRAVEWRTFNKLSFIKLLSNKRDMCTRQGKLAARVERRKEGRYPCFHSLFLSFSPSQLCNSHNKTITSSAYVMRFRTSVKRDVQVLVSSSASPRWTSITRPKAVARMVSIVKDWQVLKCVHVFMCVCVYVCMQSVLTTSKPQFHYNQWMFSL